MSTDLSKLSKHLAKGKLLIGWQEWCALPGLHVPAVKAKIDTGAKTSSLHAFNIRPFRRRGVRHVRFELHPLQANNHLKIQCESVVVDERSIISSNGHREHRFVIATQLMLSDHAWEIELTLSNRDPMTFRMLLGREALVQKTIIIPERKSCLKRYTRKELNHLYRLRSS